MRRSWRRRAIRYSVQAPILLAFVGIYVAYLSFPAFALSVVIVGLAGTVFHFRSRRLTEERAAASEQSAISAVSPTSTASKNLRMHAGRSADLFDDAVEASEESANIKIRVQAATFRLIASSQAYMYLLLAIVVFVAPLFSDSAGTASITKTTTALLFVIGAFFGLVQSIPVLLNANAAADRLAQLEVDLHQTASAEAASDRLPVRFDTIEMRNVVFQYTDQHSDTAFQIGPLDFTLQKGDLVFVTGGNGSGKSTFLRVLAGLYPIDSGEIRLDGVRVNGSNLNAYRALMSAIFFDYHLFRRLYGINDTDPVEVSRLLRQFRLEDGPIQLKDRRSFARLSFPAVSVGGSRLS